MRKPVSRIIGVVLGDDELIPSADMAVEQVAFLAEHYAIAQRSVAAQLSGFLKVRVSAIYLHPLAAVGACTLLTDISLIFNVLGKFLQAHKLKSYLLTLLTLSISLV
jgi:hypothetical protein